MKKHVLTMCKKHPIFNLIITSLIVSILSHSFMIYEWINGHYLIGMNDGLSQILPFKKLLYDHYTSGEFFYSTQFGMGGGIYSQLSYYFSTSFIYLLTVLVTFVLESLHIIAKPDLIYWGNSLVFVSIFRLTGIIVFGTLYFRYMKFTPRLSFIAGVIYGTSVIYFRHVTYWEFFSDAMLWLPLLLIGVEKIIREKRSGWFVFAVAISLFDNFYFAYINFLLAGIYIIGRWFITLDTNETPVWEQIKRYLLGGLAGFGISAVSFIPAAYGYFNNHRIPYEDAIPLFGIPDHILLDGRVVVISAFVIICLFIFSFYKNKMFRFFAVLTLITMIMHYSPIVASLFNGFSAPQYRWEHFMSLLAGGVIATGLQLIHKVTWHQAIQAIIFTVSIYALTYGIEAWYFSSAYLPNTVYLAVAALVTILFFFLTYWKNSHRLTVMMMVLIITSVFISNGYQMTKLAEPVEKEFLTSDLYNGKDQRELIQSIQEKENEPFYRIDWMIHTRNNTPIVQDFNGFSVYSSILNKHLLYFYLNHLEIDMGRESASRYMTLGDRTNLYSLLAGKYYMTEKSDQALPYQFKPKNEKGQYVVYENDMYLPFIRTTNTVFHEADLTHAPALAKEHAMLTGIILSDKASNQTIPEIPSIMDDVSMKPVQATYKQNQLNITKKSGGLDLNIHRDQTYDKDYYVRFFIKRIDQDKGYKLQVNDYKTTRKKNSSIYRTGMNDVTIRVSGTDTVSIRLPKGTYVLKDIELYEEDYTILKKIKEASDSLPKPTITWDGRHAEILYDNKNNNRYATLPIPYEKGWRLYVNGKKADILKANYAFIGFTIEEGINHIQLVYEPPYFFVSLGLTIISSLIVIIILRRKNKHRT